MQEEKCMATKLDKEEIRRTDNLQAARKNARKESTHVVERPLTGSKNVDVVTVKSGTKSCTRLQHRQ